VEKRSSDKWDSLLEKEEDEIQVKQSKSVWLQSNYPDRLIVIGKVTGRRYEFPRGGSIGEVDEQDAVEMLKIMLGGHPCCNETIAQLIPEFSVV
jgi:hypothetical protein